ncbi:tRNA adenylyltransferase [Archaeoglobus sulfaticallidus PM70-1]|uniref:CCA-adding enzyme n=1 Tax=Archaeoglobus sulfaticallidus PM70-1 TaxID=387631 RepID=N0BC09_9EURY|nr:CCA tRNA nucleotidyltransferase [Archaeoglobus sulfaticallidus]AGK60508.1 tRNA adenylyltransferase [Archaeoglobus sulfaticallidus PM70-1]
MEFDEKFEILLPKILELVVPDEDEVRKGNLAKKELENRVVDVLKDYPELEYRFLGSFPRNTWLKGNLELDLFILFPENFSEKDLERIGLEIGKRLLDSWEARYASHPYIHGTVMGVEVDVVPCYKLKSAEKIKSAVDRTPFHHDWVYERLKGKENDVRILKGFLKANGIYGAEYQVRGFSGYLCELLIIHYGSFKELVKRAINWRRGLKIEVGGNEGFERNHVLFVVDPVDSKRNVSANLSLDNFAKFVEICRDFYSSPKIEFFIKKEIDPEIAKSRVEKEMDRRGTTIFSLIFRKPDIVEDNLYTQLEKARKKLFEVLEDQDFMPLNSGYTVTEDSCILIFETQVSRLSSIRKIIGPPFEDWKNVRKFREKRKDYSAFIENGRYCSFATREHVKPEEAVMDYIRKHPKSLGKNISEEIVNCRLLSGREILEIEGIAPFLFEFFKLSP